MTEQELQELSTRLVRDNVIYCVSSLMCSVGQNLEEACNIFDEDYDEAQSLFSRPNYESAVSGFICTADLTELEELCDLDGIDWSDLIDKVGYQPAKIEAEAEATKDEAKADHLRLLANDFEEWLDDNIERWSALRDLVEECVHDPKEVYTHFNLDANDYDEVYEHWVVTDWLKRKLEARGEIVGEFAGLTIWGRCTTGQAICMDGVIERIAVEDIL